MEKSRTKALEYAAPGAGRERRRRLTRSRASLAVQLLVGGVVTCTAYLFLLRLISRWWAE